jgi:tRNA A-37 threonylcarbamoyl transferase component Bud32
MNNIKIKQMSYFYKSIISDNEDKIIKEIEIQQIASTYGFCPKIISYDIKYNPKDNKYIGNITMENLDEMCLADKYGEDAENIPKIIWDQIRTIVKILYYEKGIEYIDITGYNFIEIYGKVYIIDFGDAIYTKKGDKMNWFLREFLDGYNNFNPDFK